MRNAVLDLRAHAGNSIDQDSLLEKYQAPYVSGRLHTQSVEFKRVGCTCLDLTTVELTMFAIRTIPASPENAMALDSSRTSNTTQHLPVS